MEIQFSKRQCDLINTELGMKIEPNVAADTELQVVNIIKERCMDIEVEEVQEAEATNKPLSDRGRTAISIHDLIYDTKFAMKNDKTKAD